MRIRADLLTGAALALIGGAAAVLSIQYGWFRAGGRIGPGFVPGVSAGIMAAHGATIAVRGVAAARDGGEQGPGVDVAAQVAHAADEADPRERPRDLRSTMWVLGFMLAAIYAMKWLGFVISFSVLSFLLVAFVENEGRVRAAAYALAVGATTFVVFDLALGVPLPGGSLLR